MDPQRGILPGSSNIQFIQEDADSIFNGRNEFTGFSGSMGMMGKTEAFGKRKSEDKDLDDDSDEESITVNTANLPPRKKTKGRVKIKMEYIENKLRRYTTFSKRKTGIMKKAYELSTLTGTQVMLLVASETGHVYTFATRKLQPMITSESGKALIQTCLNSPDQDGQPLQIVTNPSSSVPSSSGDQRMNPSGFEEPELSYAVEDDDKSPDTTKSSSRSDVYVNTSSKASSQSSVRSTPSPAPTISKSPNTPLNIQPTDLTSQTVRSLSSAMATDQPVIYVPSNTTTTPAATAMKPVTMLTGGNQLTAMLPSGTPVALSNSTLANAVYKLPGTSGHMVLAAGTGGDTKPSADGLNMLAQMQMLNTAGQGGNIAMVPAPIASQPNAGAMVYQTAQGMVYATSTNQLPTVNDSGGPVVSNPAQVGNTGILLNIPQTPTVHLASGTEQTQPQTPQFITIPVPVSLANSQMIPMLASQIQQAQAESLKTSK